MPQTSKLLFRFSESPRDASSKDSPASQADSGVFSIASSNSPSKADGSTNNDETSPESLNRDRMAGFSERDLQCKTIFFGSIEVKIRFFRCSTSKSLFSIYFHENSGSVFLMGTKLPRFSLERTQSILGPCDCNQQVRKF